ncbi:MAG: Ig-like domain-containing protein [Gemmatimonadota bacterium]|nr:Ig-like domain-containing protein [Gemmatimonadota bacterium]
MMKRLVFLPLLALAACESQEPPAACGPIPQVTVNAGETAAVTACFDDPNGDVLVYSATSSNPGVATASVSGTNITIAAVAPGSASVTVTASDPGGLQGQQSFQVMVPNRAPEPRGAMPPVTVPVGRTEAVDASSYFAEPDGESLTYSATSSNPATATVSVAGSVVAVAAVAKGAAIVVVTATDPGGLTATQTFEVTVPNRAPVAGDPIADIEVFVGDGAEVDASGHFTDPDGDALTYTATSSSPANARVTVSGSTVRVTAASQGSATVTVTATDPEGLAATQTFEVTVPNRAPVAGDPIADIEVFVGDGAEVDASGHFTDPDGDALTYTATSSSPANARVTVSGSTVRVTAASQGSATVTVTATDPGGLAATQTFEVTVHSPGSFDLEMNFTSGVSSSVRKHLRDARDEWELVLKNTEFDDIRVNRTLRCLGIRGYVGTIDDHRLFVHADSIDGEGGILAVATYCYRRTSDGSPLLSATVIDEDDIEEMMDEDALVPVVFHEMGHALGFPGYWFYHDLVDTLDADDPHFEGELAIEAFDDAGGDDYDGEKVPIQLRRYGHWRESVFGDEIMSPSIDLENDEAPVSAITLQSFADVGYKVDLSRADDYELPGAEARRKTGRVFDLGNDVVWGPVVVLDTDGRVVRVIPPPPGAPRSPLPRREVLIESGRPPGPGSDPPGSVRPPLPKREADIIDPRRKPGFGKAPPGSGSKSG